MIIYFSGTDCSGKDSLMHELAKLYNYEFYMSPRSPICNIVYDTIYGRTDKVRKENNLKLIGKFLKLGARFVYVKAKPEILVERALARNEKHVNDLETFKSHMKVYKQIIEECKNKFKDFEDKFIEIDNSASLEKTAKKLMNKVNNT
jgi:thymidylate kinase